MSKIDRYRRSDVQAYLEEKIHWDEETDKEYGFYIQIRNHGLAVFEYEKYEGIIINLMNEMDEYYRG